MPYQRLLVKMKGGPHLASCSWGVPTAEDHALMLPSAAMLIMRLCAGASATTPASCASHSSSMITVAGPPEGPPGVPPGFSTSTRMRPSAKPTHSRRLMAARHLTQWPMSCNKAHSAEKADQSKASVLFVVQGC